MTGVLIKRANLDTDTHRCEDTGRKLCDDWICKENGQLTFKRPALLDGFWGRGLEASFGARVAGYMPFF